MTTEPTVPSPASEPDHVVFRLRRTFVWGSAGLLAGFVLGIGTARWMVPNSADAREAAAPLAVAMPLPSAMDTTPKVIDVSGRPARGRADAPVTIVEFTDYECPFCRDYFSKTLPAITEKYGDRIRYVVMHYPLETLHANAVGAAEAAECAADQGKFWEYHDALFTAESLTGVSLRALAGTMKLDTRRFTTCLDMREKSRLVQKDVALGTSLGVTGTPTFFVNGRVLEGAQPLPLIERAIDDAFAAAARK